MSNAKNRRNFGAFGHTLHCFTNSSKAEARGRLHKCNCNPFDHASKPEHQVRMILNRVMEVTQWR